MPRANLFFPLAALLPLPFLALGPVFGGWFAFIALCYLSAFTFLVDESVEITDAADHQTSRFGLLFADSITILLALAHLVLLPLAILAISGMDGLSIWENALNFCAFGLFFGVISTANAHELIHRTGRFRHTLGKWAFISILFGHHVSAHLAVHHRHVATPLDPNTARLNESFYSYFRRAWIGSFKSGLTAEARKLQRGLLSVHNPYVIYFAGAAVFLTLAFVLAGFKGLLIYLGFAVFAQIQLLLSEYVQHYGIERRILKGGVYEPVGLIHSWNAPHVFSAALMLNAPRHSDHHAHPSLQYSELKTLSAQGAPMLPRSLPVMSCIALAPAFWRRVMNPRVAAWFRQRDAMDQN
jgi:alkane 1-monooxygenase